MILTSQAFSQQANLTSSCTDQLKQNIWPTDCLFAFKVTKVKSASLEYQKLDTWCALKSEILSKVTPPKIFLNLSPPANCKKAAEIKLNQDSMSKILNGDFLNSFP